jgi:prefoldin subunit 5
MQELYILNLAIQFANMAGLVFVWLRRPAREAEESGRRLANQVTDMQHQIELLKQRMEHIPSPELMTEISKKLGQVDERLRGQDRALEGLERNVELVRDWILRQQGNR